MGLEIQESLPCVLTHKNALDIDTMSVYVMDFGPDLGYARIARTLNKTVVESNLTARIQWQLYDVRGRTGKDPRRKHTTIAEKKGASCLSMAVEFLTSLKDLPANMLSAKQKVSMGLRELKNFITSRAIAGANAIRYQWRDGGDNSTRVDTAAVTAQALGEGQAPSTQELANDCPRQASYFPEHDDPEWRSASFQPISGNYLGCAYIHEFIRQEWLLKKLRQMILGRILKSDHHFKFMKKIFVKSSRAFGCLFVILNEYNEIVHSSWLHSKSYKDLNFALHGLKVRYLLASSIRNLAEYGDNYGAWLSLLEQPEDYPLVWFVDDDSMGSSLISLYFPYCDALLDLYHVQSRLTQVAPNERQFKGIKKQFAREMADVWLPPELDGLIRVKQHLKLPMSQDDMWGTDGIPRRMIHKHVMRWMTSETRTAEKLKQDLRTKFNSYDAEETSVPGSSCFCFGREGRGGGGGGSWVLYGYWHI